MSKILFSVVEFDNYFGVVENASNEVLTRYYFSPSDKDTVKLMAGAYAMGYADCKYPNR